MRVLKIETSGNGGHILVGMNPQDVKFFATTQLTKLAAESIPVEYANLIQCIERASYVLYDSRQENT